MLDNLYKPPGYNWRADKVERYEKRSKMYGVDNTVYGTTGSVKDAYLSVYVFIARTFLAMGDVDHDTKWMLSPFFAYVNIDEDDFYDKCFERWKTVKSNARKHYHKTRGKGSKNGGIQSF